MVDDGEPGIAAERQIVDRGDVHAEREVELRIALAMLEQLVHAAAVDPDRQVAAVVAHALERVAEAPLQVLQDEPGHVRPSPACARGPRQPRARGRSGSATGRRARSSPGASGSRRSGLPGWVGNPERRRRRARSRRSPA